MPTDNIMEEFKQLVSLFVYNNIIVFVVVVVVVAVVIVVFLYTFSYRDMVRSMTN